MSKLQTGKQTSSRYPNGKFTARARLSSGRNTSPRQHIQASIRPLTKFGISLSETMLTVGVGRREDHEKGARETEGLKAIITPPSLSLRGGDPERQS